MIKPQDLRIGNYVNGETYETGCSVTVLQYKVKSLGEKTAVLQDRKTQSVLSYHDIKPIPLTSEWILKFGFRKVKMHGYDQHYEYKHHLLNSPITALYDSDFAISLDNSARGIQTVHRLQNIFYALTGEELTIKE